MKTYQALALALVAEGVDTVFGVMGGDNENLVATLVQEHGVRWIATRHEQGAVGMADGYSRATGKIGVASISHGPGVTNAGTTMTAARRSGSPVLVITSDFGAGQRLSNMYFEQLPFLLATIGTVRDLQTPATLGEDIELAFRHLRSGKGPIAINTRSHVINGEMPAGWSYRPTGLNQVPAQPIAPNPADVERIAALIRASQRPVILAGRGAVRSGAREALIRLAEQAGAVLATTLLTKGWFAGEPCNVGISGGFGSLGAMRLLQEADLVLAFGAELHHNTTGYGALYKNATIVQIDTNPAAINAITPVHHALIGDARLTAEALQGEGRRAKGERRKAKGEEDSLAPRSLSTADERTEVTGSLSPFALRPSPWPDAARIAAFDEWQGIDFSAPNGYVNPHLVAKLVSEQLPAERQVAIGIGSFMGIPAAHVTVPDPSGVIFAWPFGAVGCGTPIAVGAAVGRPDRLTVLFEGDGGMMMSLSELDTAARAKARLVVFVMDDGGFGAERPRYRQRGIDVELANYANPDFARVGVALGLRTFSVCSEAELRSALAAIPTIDGPALVHCRIHPDAAHPEMDRYHAIPTSD